MDFQISEIKTILYVLLKEKERKIFLFLSATLLACNDEEILMQKVQIMADDLNEKVLEKAFAISLSHRDLEKAAAAFHESKKEENN